MSCRASSRVATCSVACRHSSATPAGIHYAARKSTRRACGHRVYPPRPFVPHPRPDHVQPLEQAEELAGADVLPVQRRKGALLEPLVEQPEAPALPDQQFQLVPFAVEEGEEMPREGILAQDVAHEGGERVEGAAQI